MNSERCKICIIILAVCCFMLSGLSELLYLFRIWTHLRCLSPLPPPSYCTLAVTYLYVLLVVYTAQCVAHD